jgi:hypothetical protein
MKHNKNDTNSSDVHNAKDAMNSQNNKYFLRIFELKHEKDFISETIYKKGISVYRYVKG